VEDQSPTKRMEEEQKGQTYAIDITEYLSEEVKCVGLTPQVFSLAELSVDNKELPSVHRL